MKNDVALIKCENYDQINVDKAVMEAISKLGGIESFVKSGQNVVLKVNLVSKATPEKATTTHPSVVEAVGKLVKNVGANVIIADSAGGPYNESAMSGIYKASGMTEIAERNGFKLNDNYASFQAELPQGKVSQKFEILDVLEKADVIINLTKLKTHCFTGMSNAVKNMFGAIPGLIKVEMHGQYKTLSVFGGFLFDIQEYFKDKLVLHLTDAIVGMEGPGPTSGTPRKIGAIIAGSNPAYVDFVASCLINLDPYKLPFYNVAVERGWIDKDLPVNVLGEKVESLVVKDYNTVQANEFTPFANSMPKWLQAYVQKLTTRRPYVNRKKCKGCKKCFEHCPVKAITMVPTKKGGTPKAKFDYNKCIRCFCCQELCPFQLVQVKSGIVYKIVHRKDKKESKMKSANKI